MVSSECPSSDMGITKPTTVSSGATTTYPPSRFMTTSIFQSTMFSKAVVPQYQRPTNQHKLSKLRYHETEGLANIFSIIPLDDSDEQVMNKYNLQMRLMEFTTRLHKYDMKDVFQVLQFGLDKTIPSSEMINLLETWDTVDKDILQEHNIHTELRSRLVHPELILDLRVA